MMISFFEEFPTKENLSKLKLVSWPTKLYVAADSLKEFKKIKSSIKNKYVKEVVYWPILSKEEGYWISPFSKREALVRVLGEIKGTPVMIDAEYPLTKEPSLLMTQLVNFFRNRGLIRRFVSSHGNVYVAEYYPTGNMKEKMMSFLGLHFNPRRHRCKVIKMVYHSMHDFDREFITGKLREGREDFGDNFLVAYGTIAKGIGGNEPILSEGKLAEDLDIAKEIGMAEVVIFRLGGLDKRYCSVLKKFS